MFRFAVVTISTKGYYGERRDDSGPLIVKMLEPFGSVDEQITVPDDMRMIESELIRLCDVLNADAVFTTGGTGFSPDDVTPEATLAVVTKLVPGIPEAMRQNGLKFTDRSILSRATAGIRGRTLIVNLPGSPKACAENLNVLLPVLGHALETLRGNTSECAE